MSSGPNAYQLDTTFSRRHIETLFLLFYFSYFSQKTRFDIQWPLSSLETICMKCQILFSRGVGGGGVDITNLSSAECAQRVVKGNSYRPFIIVARHRKNTECQMRIV